MKAVLFDLDGTLIDSFPAIAASVNHVRSLHGLAPLSVPEVTRHVGHGAPHLLQAAVGAGDLQANLDEYARHHPTVIVPLTVMLPAARECLETLHARGLLLGICSNKPVAFTRILMEHLGLATMLGAVLGPEDAGRHKPAPDMLLVAMSRLGVTPAETLYIGDMRVDLETGRAAGVQTWAVATGSESAADLSSATRVMACLAELPLLLERSS